MCVRNQQKYIFMGNFRWKLYTVVVVKWTLRVSSKQRKTSKESSSSSSSIHVWNFLYHCWIQWICYKIPKIKTTRTTGQASSKLSDTHFSSRRCRHTPAIDGKQQQRIDNGASLVRRKIGDAIIWMCCQFFANVCNIDWVQKKPAIAENAPLNSPFFAIERTELGINQLNFEIGHNDEGECERNARGTTEFLRRFIHTHISIWPLTSSDRFDFHNKM